MKYYKSKKNNHALWCLKDTDKQPKDSVEISENDFNTLQEQNKFSPNTTLKRIGELKSLLQQTDFKAIKYAEGYYTEEEYAPIKLQRQQWRDEINRLESALYN